MRSAATGATQESKVQGVVGNVPHGRLQGLIGEIASQDFLINLIRLSNVGGIIHGDCSCFRQPPTPSLEIPARGQQLIRHRCEG
jgi:hypothetical protein